ncbi:MAG: hypothetical protein II969_03960 [Anaerolineaceae bacterium]|nr:hypothetical protein [Anaerolineaceae bacterium]
MSKRNKKGVSQPVNRMKTQSERQAYNRAVITSKTESHPTVMNPNENLIGSNEMDSGIIYDYQNNEKPEIDTPTRVKVKRYFTDKGDSIIAGVLTAAAIGLFSLLLSWHSNLSKLEVRVSYIEKDISTLAANYDELPEKYASITSLQQSLEQLQASMDTGILLSTKDITHKLDLIELKLSELQKTDESVDR